VRPRKLGPRSKMICNVQSPNNRLLSDALGLPLRRARRAAKPER
jgi:hypothetical protein